MSDFTSEDATLQFFPRLPTLSSYLLNWEDIYVAYYQQPAWEMPESCAPFHTISINTINHEISLERVLDGQRQQLERSVNREEIVISPANITHQANWDREIEFMLLFLYPNYIARIAYESVDPDRVELLTQFEILDPLIHQLGMLFLSELKSQELGSRLYVDSLKTALAVALLRRYSNQKNAIRDYTDGLSKPKLRRALAYINDNLAENLSLQDIAGELEMSHCYFTSLFKQSTGLTAHQYVTKCRVNKAQQLLAQTNLSIIEVAQETGFQSQSHFSRLFRKQTGTNPRAYRKSQKSAQIFS
jgi:AraC family transcriptional regulator